MKTLFAVLVSLFVAFNSYGAVSGTTPGTGGSGSGSSTNAYAVLIQMSTNGIPVIVTNSTRTNLIEYPLLGTNGITITLATGGGNTNVLIGINLGTNDMTYATNAFAIDTVQTNSTTNILLVTTSLKHVPTATEGTRASVVVESAAGSGTWLTLTDTGIDGTATANTETNIVAFGVAPGIRYYITNQSIGAAAVTVNRSYIQKFIIGGVGGSGGGGSGTVTSVDIVSDFQTVTGNPITTAGTITLTSPYIPANSNGLVIVSNGLVMVSNVTVNLSNYIGSISNGLLTLSNSIPALSNGLVTVSNGLVTISNSIVPLSNGLVTVSNGLLTLSNSIPPLSNALVAVSNGVAVVSNGLVGVSNGVVVVSNGLTALSNAVVFRATNAGGVNSIINNSNAPVLAFKSISAGSGVTITDTLTNLSIAASGGGGSGFPLSADADVGGFALTNLYKKNLTFTSAHTLATTESGIAFNNIGATTRIDFTLPAPTVSVWYTFTCMDADGLRVLLPAGTSVIQLSSLTTSTGTGGGYIDTTTIGNSVTLICVSSTQWVAISITGGGEWTTN